VRDTASLTAHAVSHATPPRIRAKMEASPAGRPENSEGTDSRPERAAMLRPRRARVHDGFTPHFRDGQGLP